jgi:O-antigen/teichoic acid export membrane protein
MTPYIIIYFLSVHLVMVVIAFKAQKLYLVANTIKFILTVAFSFLLIPRYGLIGIGTSLL